MTEPHSGQRPPAPLPLDLVNFATEAALLAAGPRPPQALPAASLQVCACHDVSEAVILAALPGCVGAGLQKLAPLQARLRCGTDCGSCLPAVKALLQREALAQPVPI